jgi:EAL domain-containing protein (putative c-di-GMP-specific phosphodiesterase class I)
MVEVARSTARSVGSAPFGPVAWLLAANGAGALVVLNSERARWVVPCYCVAVSAVAIVVSVRERALWQRLSLAPAGLPADQPPTLLASAASESPRPAALRRRLPARRPLASAAELARALPLALADNELHLHYQPIVRLGDGVVVGAEALLRWQHARLGSVSPAVFVPIAERIGMLDELGDWVIGRGFAEGSGLLRALQVDEPYVSINVAPSQMARPGFVDSVRGHLRRLDVAPDGFVFELTEQGMVGDRERAMSAIADLQDLGVLVAMDDFGAGNASLISLSNLDLDIVKLDRALVAGLDTTRGFRILRTAIDLLRDLGVVIIAEGIEQPAVTSMLTRLGVNYGQGFGLGRPEPLDALLRRLALSPVVDLRDSVVKPLFSVNR